MHRTLRPPRRRLLAALSALAVAVAVLPVVLAATAPPAAATGVPAPTWTQQSPATSPSARYGAAMAFDESTGQTLLFGGAGTGTALADTWTWNGTTWTQLSPATSPPARFGASMAFDPSTGQMLLFGGVDGTGTPLADTWTWNGTTWTQLSPATSPPARYLASMAFDPSTGQMLLFGGFDGGGTPLADTWTWNGTTWTQLTPATSPPARFAASMAFDPSTGQMLLFGGTDTNTVLGDTWVWGRPPPVTYGWTQLSPATSPPARYAAGMAFDPTTGQTLLFGGGDGLGTPLADTWAWNGTTWTQQSPTTSPSARYGAVMAFDASTGQMLLFGGLDVVDIPLGDTWTWDGTTWTQLTPATSPSARSSASMAFDPSTGQMLLFGGVDGGGTTLADTWTWNGTTWTQLTPATSPSIRSEAAMAFDPTTGQTLLFGGAGLPGTVLADTWTWNGTTWTQLSPAASPPARFGAGMAFDPSIGRMLLFGGLNGSYLNVADTWTWNGTTWTQQSPATSPSARWGGEMAFDPSTGQMLLFGGNGAGGRLADTWVWGPVAAPAAPTVSAISPNSGPLTGGTPVTITGTGFAAGATVTIGGVACGPVVVNSAIELTCTTGASIPVATKDKDAVTAGGGGVDVVVTVGGQASTGGTGLFTYTEFVPGPPTGVTLTAGPGPGRGTVTATPPAGPTPFAYQTRCMPPGTRQTSTAAPAAWVHWPTLPVWIDLTPGYEYRCKVRARYGGPNNEGGGDWNEGPLSEWSNTVLILGAPNAPTGLTQTVPALPSGRNVTLNWSVTPGGAARPVTGQEARCTSSTGGVTRTATLTPAARRAQLTALTQGASYVCEVRAVNGVGASAWVAAPGFVVPQAAPRNVVASTPVARATRVSFVPAAGGLSVSNYRATCTSTNGGTTRTGTATASPVTVSNLTAGKQYRCTVTPRIGTTDGATSVASNPVAVP